MTTQDLPVHAAVIATSEVSRIQNQNRWLTPFVGILLALVAIVHQFNSFGATV